MTRARYDYCRAHASTGYKSIVKAVLIGVREYIRHDMPLPVREKYSAAFAR